VPDALPEAPPEPPPVPLDLTGAGEIASPANGSDAKAVQREAPAGPETVPSLKERFSGVLFSPVATFRALEPSWGWGTAWAAIAVTGMVKGILRVGLNDLTAAHQALWQRQLDHMTEQQRRMFLEAIRDDSVPAKWSALMEKIGEVALPWIGTLLSIVGVGLVLFGAAYALGGRRDLIRSVVIAAHAKLVMVVGYAVLAVATLLGNPAAQTSLANAADPITSPSAVAALSLLDPIAIWHTVLLGIALTAGLGVSARRSFAFTVTVQGLAWISYLGLSAVGMAMSKQG